MRMSTYVMLGCPHASIEQIWEVASLLEGKKLNAGTKLWIFTSRSVKSMADTNGYTKTIRDAGGTVMTDTCSAIGQAVPQGHQGGGARFSAKQSHYLPAIMGIEAWFGTTEDCIEAAHHRPLAWRTAMSVEPCPATMSSCCRPQGDRRRRRGRSTGDAQTISGWGGIDSHDRHGYRDPPRAARRQLQGQDSGLSRRQGLVGLVGRVSHDPPDQHRAQGDGVHRHDHQDRARRGGHAMPAVTDLDRTRST